MLPWLRRPPLGAAPQVEPLMPSSAASKNNLYNLILFVFSCKQQTHLLFNLYFSNLHLQTRSLFFLQYYILLFAPSSDVFNPTVFIAVTYIETKFAVFSCKKEA
jgi:hypothetical protein